MLSSIRVLNFKCHKDAAIKVKPLTVLVGPNSGGKSALTQPLLLLKQLFSGHASINSPTRGPFADFGEPKYLLSRGAESSHIGVYLEYATYRTDTCSIGVEFNVTDGFSTSKIVVDNEVFDRKNNFLSHDNPHIGLSVRSVFRDPDLLFDTFTPISINPLLMFSKLAEMTRKIDDLKADQKDRNDIDIGLSNEDSTNKYQESLENKLEIYNMILGGLQYLSANRQSPKQFYEFSELERERLSSEVAMLLHYLVHSAPVVGTKLDNSILRMGIGTSFAVKTTSTGYVFSIKRSDDAWDSIANVGHGTLSAVMILLNTIVSAHKSRISVIQEPEIYLHPNTQRLLVEELVRIITSNEGIITSDDSTHIGRSKVILETHSEHIVRGIQIAVAKRLIDKDDIAIYFIDNNLSPSVRLMELDDMGILKRKWPNDFYGTAFSMAMELKNLSRN